MSKAHNETLRKHACALALVCSTQKIRGNLNETRCQSDLETLSLPTSHSADKHPNTVTQSYGPHIYPGQKEDLELRISCAEDKCCSIEFSAIGRIRPALVGEVSDVPERSHID